jgi:hypothetical protein
MICNDSSKWTAVAAEEEYAVFGFDGDGPADCFDKLCRFPRPASQ